VQCHRPIRATAELPRAPPAPVSMAGKGRSGSIEETASACRRFSSLLSPSAAHTINGKGCHLQKGQARRAKGVLARTTVRPAFTCLCLWLK
jgi:hypothetical protein